MCNFEDNCLMYQKDALCVGLLMTGESEFVKAIVGGVTWTHFFCRLSGVGHSFLHHHQPSLLRDLDDFSLEDGYEGLL